MLFFFFNDTATTEIYTLSLHDALPIWTRPRSAAGGHPGQLRHPAMKSFRRHERAEALPSLLVVAEVVEARACRRQRSEEHTSELQSRQYLVCRLLLEKKKILQSLTYFD